MGSEENMCSGFPENLVLSLVPIFSHKDIQSLLIRKVDNDIIFTSRGCLVLTVKKVCDSCEKWFGLLLGPKVEIETDEERDHERTYELLDLEYAYNNGKGLDSDEKYDCDSDDDWEEETIPKKQTVIKKDPDEQTLLRKKLKRQKKDPGPDIIECTVCKEVFKSAPFWSATKKLFRHEQDTHQLHMIICQDCGQQFKNKKELERHSKKVHFNQPLAKCEICGVEVKFIEPHMRLMHSDVPKPPSKQFICELCGKVFKYKEGHRAHMGTYHTGEKSFSCKICGASYYRRQGRDRCLKNHQGKENFKHSCEFCGRKFLDKVKLTLHLRTHTREKPYSCPLCKYTAARRDYMQKHIVSQHKDTTIALLEEAHPDFLSPPSSKIKTDPLLTSENNIDDNIDVKTVNEFSLMSHS